MYSLPSHTAIIPAAAHNTRLDAALALLRPSTGIRGRRRVWKYHTVTVNGVSRPPGYCVAAGDRIAIISAKQPYTSPIQPRHVTVLHTTTHFAALYKPAGLHSATMAASPHLSAEDMLHSLLCPGHTIHTPILVNRLDHATSGILVVALHSEAAGLFRQQEDAGHIKKLYLAITEGAMSAPLLCPWVLDTTNRAVTKVLPHVADDPIRHTSVLPLRGISLPYPEGPHTATLVLAEIAKGARHQIRAHLAHAGHPIVGDAIYGNSTPDGRMYLHHFCFEMTDFSCTCPPRWTLLPDLIKAR